MQNAVHTEIAIDDDRKPAGRAQVGTRTVGVLPETSPQQRHPTASSSTAPPITRHEMSAAIQASTDTLRSLPDQLATAMTACPS